MHTLACRVLRTIKDHDLIPPGGRVIVALSGGPDSVALVHLLRELAEHGELVVAGLAHFNHQLRGAAAERDEQFCRDFANRLSLTIDVETCDVAALARERRRSIEDVARLVRYAFLERAASRLAAERTAVGHTRDDQAETFLLRLVRGAGTRGLASIRPRAGSVVRPMLDLSRQQVHAYLSTAGAAFCQDETNLDTQIPRNFVRHVLIPAIEKHLTQSVVNVLAREAEIAREDDVLLDNAATEAARSIVQSIEGRITLDADALSGVPVALARRIVYKALTSLAGERFVGFDHVEALRHLAAQQSVGAESSLDLPGQRAVRSSGGRIILTAGREHADKNRLSPFVYPLPIPGQVEVLEADVVVSAVRQESAHVHPSVSADMPGSVSRAVVADASLGDMLAVRNRKPGDVFRPLGLGGRKKLQDYLVDRKIARETRDRVPIVVDGRDRIVWVVGHAIEDDFRVTTESKGVVILTATRFGELI